MTDKELNPYAPPVHGSDEPNAQRGLQPDDDHGVKPRRGVDYEAERESVLFCIAWIVGDMR